MVIRILRTFGGASFVGGAEYAVDGTRYGSGANLVTSGNILRPDVVIEPWEGDYWLQPLVVPRLGMNSCYRTHGDT
jgi:hypothetical protein